MITIETVNKLLSKEEKENLITNIINENKCIKNCLSNFSTLYDLMERSFIWNNTKQGYNYWYNIYKRIREKY